MQTIAFGFDFSVLIKYYCEALKEIFTFTITSSKKQTKDDFLLDVLMYHQIVIKLTIWQHVCGKS
jgi:hypothetical protein